MAEKNGKSAAVPPVPLICLGLAAIFLVRTLSWAMSELWYDEVLSLQYFVFGMDSPGGIFRSYPMANNHFLSNWLEWFWVQLPGMSSSEYLIRVPSLIAGAAAVMLIFAGWRKRLGQTLAAAAALLTALSPVFAAFAWQMRGYSLAMLLAAAAVTLAFSVMETPTAAGKCALFAVSLLLPLTMPSAAMAPMAISAGMAASVFFSEGRSIKKAVLTALPPFAGALLGTAYYLTLWSEFCAARSEAGGWTSAWAVLGSVLGAFILHLGIFAAAPAAALFRRFRGGELSPLACRALWQLGGALLALCAVLLLPASAGRSPFPRVFLVLLPPVTLSAAALAREHLSFVNRLAAPRLLLLTALPAVVITLVCEQLTGAQLDKPQPPPQNLLMQYYRGASDARSLAYEFASGRNEALAALSPRRVIIADPYMATTLLFYWQSAQLPLTLPGGISAVMPGNLLKPEAAQLFQSSYAPEMLFFARTTEDAEEMAAKLEIPGEILKFSVILRGEHWHLCRGERIK